MFKHQNENLICIGDQYKKNTTFRLLSKKQSCVKVIKSIADENINKRKAIDRMADWGTMNEIAEKDNHNLNNDNSNQAVDECVDYKFTESITPLQRTLRTH